LVVSHIQAQRNTLYDTPHHLMGKV
jgi:hypothetical protein